MAVMDKWTCSLCGKPTDSEDKVCVACRKGSTAVEATVDKSDVNGGFNMEKREVCDALRGALDLEVEGMEFYTKCAERTSNRDGKDMFNHLAGEEKKHYQKVTDIFRRLYANDFCEYEAAHKHVGGAMNPSGVFQSKVAGGSLDKKSDALDALNIALNAEEKSIDLYQKLADSAEEGEAQILFRKLVDEEKTHRSILEAEAEFITDTGEFHDFKTVTT